MLRNRLGRAGNCNSGTSCLAVHLLQLVRGTWRTLLPLQGTQASLTHAHLSDGIPLAQLGSARCLATRPARCPAMQSPFQVFIALQRCDSLMVELRQPLHSRFLRLWALDACQLNLPEALWAKPWLRHFPLVAVATQLLQTNRSSLTFGVRLERL